MEDGISEEESAGSQEESQETGESGESEEESGRKAVLKN